MAKTLTIENEDTFFDKLEVGEVFAYIEAFFSEDIIKTAAQHGLHVEYCSVGSKEWRENACMAMKVLEPVTCESCNEPGWHDKSGKCLRCGEPFDLMEPVPEMPGKVLAGGFSVEVTRDAAIRLGQTEPGIFEKAEQENAHWYVLTDGSGKIFDWGYLTRAEFQRCTQTFLSVQEDKIFVPFYSSESEVPRKVVEDLKQYWLTNPFWDLEEMEGFESVRRELYWFRVATERQWDLDAWQEVIKSSPVFDDMDLCHQEQKRRYQNRMTQYMEGNYDDTNNMVERTAD